MEILCFPSNEFANQEPKSNDEIQEFVRKRGVQFPVFAKTTVNGKHAHPIFNFLRAKLGGLLGAYIKWNFTKFLCDRDGVPVKRYSPPTKPLSLEDDIVQLLNTPAKTDLTKYKGYNAENVASSSNDASNVPSSSNVASSSDVPSSSHVASSSNDQIVEHEEKKKKKKSPRQEEEVSKAADELEKTDIEPAQQESQQQQAAEASSGEEIKASPRPSESKSEDSKL